jgi:hypothetical protein
LLATVIGVSPSPVSLEITFVLTPNLEGDLDVHPPPVLAAQGCVEMGLHPLALPAPTLALQDLSPLVLRDELHEAGQGLQLLGTVAADLAEGVVRIANALDFDHHESLTEFALRREHALVQVPLLTERLLHAPALRDLTFELPVLAPVVKGEHRHQDDRQEEERVDLPLIVPLDPHCEALERIEINRRQQRDHADSHGYHQVSGPGLVHRADCILISKIATKLLSRLPSSQQSKSQ